jgi:S-adenosylmethionine synthetase
MDLLIEPLQAPSPASQPIEVVERKGLGHPDTLCDALAEQLSINLCRFYRDRFGLILHHNVDKVLLYGGASRPAFGGGQVLEPLEIFLAGRATREVDGVKVPIDAFAFDGSRDWLRRHFHALDTDRHVRIHCLVRPGSADLVDLYLRQRQLGPWLANDTSCGVGFAPLSDLERVVLGVETHLNSSGFKSQFPEYGEDIKIMGVRNGRRIVLTLACAFVDRFVRDLRDYLDKKIRLAHMAGEAAARVTDMEVKVEVNTGDDEKRGNVYLTVTGTSAEAGDDGQVGRGNRVNGLITPYRPMTLEAAAGKNPITHVGKLYNVIANEMASVIVESIPEVTECECYLVSQIGRPVADPQVMEIKLRTERRPVPELAEDVRHIAYDRLRRMSELWRALVGGELRVY